MASLSLFHITPWHSRTLYIVLNYYNFRKLLLELYQAIDKKELRELHFFLKSKVKKSLVDKNLMEVFILLEQNKLLSPGFLIEMMKTVHRNDLITKIKCHIGKQKL